MAAFSAKQSAPSLTTNTSTVPVDCVSFRLLAFPVPPTTVRFGDKRSDSEPGESRDYLVAAPSRAQRPRSPCDAGPGRLLEAALPCRPSGAAAPLSPACLARPGRRRLIIPGIWLRDSHSARTGNDQREVRVAQKAFPWPCGESLSPFCTSRF